MLDRKIKLHIAKLFLLVFVCMSSSYSFSQPSTVIRGKVLDAQTKEPVAFAIVSYDNSTLATSTQLDGTFSLTNRRDLTKVTVSLIGYHSKTITITANKINYREILLEPADTELSEVIVKPKKEKYSKKDNPAVTLIKKVIEHKDKNNIKALNYYQYKEYERYTFAFNEFNPESGVFKNYKFLSNYTDSSLIDKKPILPFSVKEKITDVFYRHKPKTEKRIIKGQKTEGIDQKLEQQGIEAFVEATFQHVDIFDNYIPLLYNNFVSPLSSQQAVSFYKWYLGDTVQIDQDRYVRLDFAPFNSLDKGFTGHLYISLDSMYAVKKAELNTPKNIDVNWVTDMVVHQEFEKSADGVWLPKEYRTAMDLSIYDALKLYVDKTITMEDFLVNMPLPPVYELPDPIHYEKDYNKRPDSFWADQRPTSHKTDHNMDDLVHEMKDVFLVKVIMNLGNILMTGFIPLDKDPDINKFEFGTVPTFFSYNRVEGARFKLTGSTTRNFHPHLFLYGYGAYGTKDGKFKYMGEATWAFKEVRGYKDDYPKNNLSIGYKYDMNALGRRFTQAERDNILMSLSSSKKSKLTYNRQFSISYDREHYNGIYYKVQFQTSNERPAQGIVFEKHDIDNNVTPVKNLRLADATVTLGYVHNEKFFPLRRKRIPIPSERFMIELSNTTSFKNFMGGQYSFNKTVLRFDKDFWVTPYGKINVIGRAEKIWGEAPFTSLITPNANSSFTLQKGSYYLLEPLEFIHDEQVSWEVYYYLGGLIFKRLPLIKHLKWREVVGFRGFYGRLSKRNNPLYNREQLVFPDQSYQTSGGKPYMEFNVGIENIFNFFRIDYVRRINYNHHPDVSRDGIRVSFEMNF